MTELTNDAYKLVTQYAKEYYEQSRGKQGGGFMSITVYSDLAEVDIHQLDSGFGREVFSLPAKFIEDANHPDGYIIKFPEYSKHSTANGKEQNQYEIEAWKNRLAPYRDYIVPIIDYHPHAWWIVMPNVDIIDIKSQDGKERLQELEQAGFEFSDEVELGWYNGELRLLDYGYQVEVSHPFEVYENKWYKPDSDKYLFAVKLPDSDRRYYKTKEGAVNRLLSEYGP